MKKTRTHETDYEIEHNYEFGTPMGTTRSVRVAYDKERRCLNISAIDGLQPKDFPAFVVAVLTANHMPEPD